MQTTRFASQEISTLEIGVLLGEDGVKKIWLAMHVLCSCYSGDKQNGRPDAVIGGRPSSA